MANAIPTVTFLGTGYVPHRNSNAEADRDAAVKTLDDLAGSELVTLYNLVASNLGVTTVKRFADKTAAVSRTWARLVEWKSQLDEAFEMPAEELAAQKLRVVDPATPFGGADNVVPHFSSRGMEKVALAPQDKAHVAEEAAARPPVAPRKSDQLIAAAAATRGPVLVSGRRKSKREEPSARCYKPRAGSKQAQMYALISREGGVPVDEFCAEMNRDYTGKMEWAPGNVWGGLRYLFVTQKGYGLDFNGETDRVSLLVGKEEVEATPAGTTK